MTEDPRILASASWLATGLRLGVEFRQRDTANQKQLEPRSFDHSEERVTNWTC